jgi:Flp pilus assembly pilin Flp
VSASQFAHITSALKLSPTLLIFLIASALRNAGRWNIIAPIRRLWLEEGQDIAEYAVMLALILVLAVGTLRLVGSNANNAFSWVASSIQ